MGASECHHSEASAPPAVTQALCVVCKEAAAQRCEECFDEEEGHLYFCAKDACFDAQHPECQRRKHRKSLVSWDCKAQWTDKCCATHKGNLLAVWCRDCSTVVCALCCLHGEEHTGHNTSLVIDAVKGIQEQLQATMEQLDENVKNRERLRQLKEEEDGLASGNGAVGDARRALQEVKALFLAKVDALDGELDATAARWSAQVVAEHEQLARYTRSVQSLVDDMRATCAEEKAEEAQRVVIARTELCAQRDALGGAPPVCVRALEFGAAPLRQAVADLSAHTIEGVRSACAACGSGVPKDTVQCDDCVEAVRAFEAGGGGLQNASESLRANKAVVLAAVAQNGFSLEYANEELRADKMGIGEGVAGVNRRCIFLGGKRTEDVLRTMRSERSARRRGRRCWQEERQCHSQVQTTRPSSGCSGSSNERSTHARRGKTVQVPGQPGQGASAVLRRRSEGERDDGRTIRIGCGGEAGGKDHLAG